jgi:GTP-sensing pleiotropic transcriptional regulator CodY
MQPCPAITRGICPWIGKFQNVLKVSVFAISKKERICGRKITAKIKKDRFLQTNQQSLFLGILSLKETVERKVGIARVWRR